MKRATEEEICLETVSRSAGVHVRESHPVFQKCLEPHGWTGASISRYGRIVFVNPGSGQGLGIKLLTLGLMSDGTISHSTNSPVSIGS